MTVWLGWAVWDNIKEVGPVFPKKREEPKEPGHYFVAELSPEIRGWLIAVVKAKAKSKSKEHALEALETAMLVDLPLLRGAVDWAEAERLARERGSTLADFIFDRGGASG
jgi:hypothetical protein